MEEINIEEDEDLIKEIIEYNSSPRIKVGAISNDEDENVLNISLIKWRKSWRKDNCFFNLMCYMVWNKVYYF